MTANGIKIGLLLQNRRPVLGGQHPQDAELMFSMAQRVEEAGLDSIWVGDSLMYNPRLEALTLLAALAARTQRVRLGTSILLAALRQPALLAAAAGTLDVISRGRMVLGVGIGSNFTEEQRDEWQAEWSAAGVDSSRRVSRLEEVVEIVKRLGAGENVSFSGRHFDLDSVSILPRAVQQGGVPFLFVCDSARRREVQVRRAVRLGDGIIIGSAPLKSWSA